MYLLSLCAKVSLQHDYYLSLILSYGYLIYGIEAGFIIE